MICSLNQPLFIEHLLYVGPSEHWLQPQTRRGPCLPAADICGGWGRWGRQTTGGKKTRSRQAVINARSGARPPPHHLSTAFWLIFWATPPTGLWPLPSR